ncbi:uncharacterized protein AB675_6796 [Cyphellophora attinorum]|uniref:Uncharacterized protein n=1 Tax=Cyphellophora attinorum TaxID=1664694 RepID=A0A0N1HES0_9EURO|nr:uncharacterized protein AB675_6796 [Phialophora attinorum]KPI43582.1 hypothetical protein AB675_6796 [Phialophora attinorum]
MEAVVAVGLASNILGFIEFAASLVHIQNELKNNSLVAEYRSYQDIARDIQKHAKRIKAGKEGCKNDEILVKIADNCCTLADQLFRRVKASTNRHGTNIFNRTLTAISTLWNKREILEIMYTLDQLRSELIMHRIHEIGRQQIRQEAAQAGKEDLRNVVKLLHQLQSDLDALKLDDAPRPKTKRSMSLDLDKAACADICPSCKAILETDASASDMVGADGNNGSLSTRGQRAPAPDVCRPRVKAHPVVTPLYIATRKDDTERLNVPMDTKADMNCSKAQHRRGCVGLVKTATISECKRWIIASRLCQLSLVLRSKVVPAKIRTRNVTLVYQIEVHLAAASSLSSWIFSTVSLSCSIVLSMLSRPRMTLQPTTYRTLGCHHEVWMVIEHGDLDQLRSLLTEKRVFPSDRDCRGSTLLHNAAFFNQLEVCKCLISYGADINATNDAGLTPIVDASVTWKIMEADNGLDVFYHLLSLSSISLDAFWENEQYVFRSAQSFDCFFHDDSVLHDLEPDTVAGRLSNWLSSCHSIEADLDVSGSHTLLALVIAYLSERALLTQRCCWWQPLPAYQNFLVTSEEDGPDRFLTLKRRILVFDHVLDLVNSDMFRGRLLSAVPMVSTVKHYISLVCEARSEHEALQQQASDGPREHRQVCHRGFHITFCLATNLKFLEHVLFAGLTTRADSDTVMSPDCLKEDGEAISELFAKAGMRHIWVDILQELGVD